MQASGCPFHQKDGGQTSLASTNNSDWWPNALNLDILSQHDKKPTRWILILTMQPHSNHWI
jgi:catalase-peroxidase